MKDVLRYSPFPQESYMMGLGRTAFAFHLTNQPNAVWNLVWLTYPQVDRGLDPDADKRPLMGEDWSSRFGYMAGHLTHTTGPTWMLDIMGDDPVAFVESLKKHSMLHTCPMYMEHPKWLETLTRRAALAAGCGRSNVFSVDFKNKKRA